MTTARTRNTTVTSHTAAHCARSYPTHTTMSLVPFQCPLTHLGLRREEMRAVDFAARQHVLGAGAVGVQPVELRVVVEEDPELAGRHACSACAAAAVCSNVGGVSKLPPLCAKTRE